MLEIALKKGTKATKISNKANAKMEMMILVVRTVKKILDIVPVST